MEDKIINEKVDSMLKEIEEIFKKAVEGNKACNEELDKKVKVLVDEHDKKKEVVKYQKVKDLTDFIALAISMPIKEEIKEEIIKELLEECEKDE